MSKNRWLLPDGIDEIVANDARAHETLRRELLDLFDSWGYDLVIPPMIEFTDSLLTGLGEQLDLQTFKFRDQLSGKSLGVRADISPQVARIDAHSMERQGANRLCYAGTVLRSTASEAFASRAPSQIGAELFGVEEIDADLEIISLMLTSLQCVSERDITLEISHQLVRNWLQQISSDADLAFDKLCTLIREKRLPELEAFLCEADIDSVSKNKLCQLPRLMGGVEILDTAKKLFAQDALMAEAIEEMQLLSGCISAQYPEVELFFNLSEIQFSDYHSGVLFAAYSEIDEVAIKVANGGRYNEVGEAFGRSRPATGFSACLKVLARFFDADFNNADSAQSVYALALSCGEGGALDPLFWKRVEELRNQGYRVQLGYSSEKEYVSETACSQRLVEKDGEWILQDIR